MFVRTQVLHLWFNPMGPHFKSLFRCIKHLLSFSFVISYIYIYINNLLFLFFSFLQLGRFLPLYRPLVITSSFSLHNLVIFQRFLYLSTTSSWLHVVQTTRKRREQHYKKMRENDWPRWESKTQIDYKEIENIKW